MSNYKVPEKLSDRDRIMALLSPPSQSAYLTARDARWIKNEIESLRDEVERWHRQHTNDVLYYSSLEKTNYDQIGVIESLRAEVKSVLAEINDIDRTEREEIKSLRAEVEELKRIERSHIVQIRGFIVYTNQLHNQIESLKAEE